MLALNANLYPAQIEQILEATCDPIDDGYLYPGLYGAGKLNAYCAVYQSWPLNLSHSLSGTYSSNVSGGIGGRILYSWQYKQTVNGSRQTISSSSSIYICSSNYTGDITLRLIAVNAGLTAETTKYISIYNSGGMPE